MKKRLLFIVLSFALTQELLAQISFSYSLSDINAAMPTGIKLPDGTYIKVAKIQTGTGVLEANTGQSGPFLGGQLDSVWSGCPGCSASSTTSNTLVSYTGDTNPLAFTRLFQSLASDVDNGSSNNCEDAIGWRIYFDRPLDLSSFLVVDLDGNHTVNGEWSTAFSFNGTTFSSPSSKTFPTDNLTSQDITVGAGHIWRTMLQAEVGATAEGNFPSATNGVNITRIKNVAGALDPDDLKTQVLYDFPLATDLFFLWGVWGTITTSGSQNSGNSPITINVYPDFGDAPDSYGTLQSSNGPSHGQRTSISVNELRLGATEDIESDGLPSANADSGLDDDGISSVPTIGNDESLSQLIPSYSFTTSFTNITGSDANYVAWVDWDNSGVFDPAEGQTATTLAATTSGSVTFTWTNVTLSGTDGLANTYARLRVTTEAGMSTSTPGGSFKDGEVEDYFIPFTIPLSASLPVNLIDFSGHRSKDKGKLSWHSVNEINMDHYEVQISENNINFHSIGQIQADNNEINNYAFDFDLSASQTNAYFRLNMIDIDGSSRYSKVIYVTSSIDDPLIGKISPNPIGSEITFIYQNSMGDSNLEMEIWDLAGKVLLSRAESIKNGRNTIHISSNEFAQGVYFLHYSDKRYQTSGIITFVVSP